MTLTLLDEYSLSDVNSIFTLKYGFEARITALSDGRIAATWTESFGDKHIHLRLFNADGSPAGASQVVSDSLSYTNGDSQISALPNGGFVVTWSKNVSSGEDNIYARVYGADGQPTGASFLVSPDGGNVNSTADDDRFADVLGLADGSTVFVWEARGPNDLYGRVLAADGVTLGTPVMINTAGEDARMVQLANGDVLVLIGQSSNTGLTIRLSGPDLTSAPQGVPGATDPVVIALDQAPGEHTYMVSSAPNPIQPLASGGFVMCYRFDTDIRYDTPIDVLRLEWYNAAGTLERQVDMDIPAPAGGEEYSLGQLIPLPDDRLVLIWQVKSQSEDFNLMVQLLNADGTADGAAQALTNSNIGIQSLYEAVLLENGNVAVTWADGSNLAVEGGIDPIHIRVIEIAEAVDPYGATNGNDVLSGTNAVDLIHGLDGNDVLRGLGGGDSLSGGAGNDRLLGQGGNDWLTGEAGRDRLDGGTGKDYLDGGIGNDILKGGLGQDVMVGGAGQDTFVFNTARDSGATNRTRDTIADFQRGVDKIDLGKLDAVTTISGNQDFVFIGKSVFSGTAGELRFAAGRLSADLDGDGQADFQVDLTAVKLLGVDDFIL